MATKFDPEAAKKFLDEKEARERAERESLRKELLARVIAALKEEFHDTDVQAYVVGSILRVNQFTENSDVDIVVKNFKGDRFALWTSLEAKIGRNIEVILYDACNFKEFVETDGLRAI